MSRPADNPEREPTGKYVGSTVVDLTKRPDGSWEATQDGLDVVGVGDSAARATEDMAGQIATLKESKDN